MCLPSICFLMLPKIPLAEPSWWFLLEVLCSEIRGKVPSKWSNLTRGLSDSSSAEKEAGLACLQARFEKMIISFLWFSNHSEMVCEPTSLPLRIQCRSWLGSRQWFRGNLFCRFWSFCRAQSYFVGRVGVPTTDIICEDSFPSRQRWLIFCPKFQRRCCLGIRGPVGWKRR